MDEKELLRKLGLTEYESQIASALLHLRASKVSEIIKKCNVPKNKIYESLESLSKKGIVQIIPSVPKRYFIKSIDSLKILLKQKEDNLEQLKKDFSELKKKEDRTLNLVNEPVGIIYGHESFVSKLKDSLKSVSKENLILARKVRTDPVMLRLTEEAVKRGAKIKMLIPKTDLEKVREWRRAGVKVRFLDKTQELFFSTFDDKICRININLTDNLNDPTIWIENKAFINLLREKFTSLWKKAKK